MAPIKDVASARAVAASVGNLLFDGAHKHADRTLIEFRGRAIGFAEVAAAAENVAAELAALGVGKGDIVALYFPNTPHYPVVFFAAMRLGAIVVNLTPLDAPRELRFKIKDTGARILATLDHLPFNAHANALLAEGLIDMMLLGSNQFWEDGRTDVIDADAIISLDAAITKSSVCRAAAIDPDDLALIQYTGGTTGTPKGAMISHRNLLSAVEMFDAGISAASSWRPGEGRHIGVLPLFHIYALAGVMLRATAHGETIMLRDRFDATQTLDDICSGGASFFFGVPTMFIALLDLPDIWRFDLSSLTLCVSGGAPLPGDVASRMARLIGRPPTVGWGMTETCGAGTLGRGKGVNPAGAIGHALPGASITILALEGEREEVGPGKVGEITIDGPNVFAGYWNRPDESASAFAGTRLLTGDMGFVDPDGQIHLVDRMKDMIISSGFNVYPRAVEDAIYEHPAVTEAVVFGVRDSYRGEIAVAAVKLRSSQTLSLDELRLFLADKLGRHELPARLEVHDTPLPRTAAGKLSRKELRDAYTRGPVGYE